MSKTFERNNVMFILLKWIQNNNLLLIINFLILSLFFCNHVQLPITLDNRESTIKLNLKNQSLQIFFVFNVKYFICYDFEIFIIFKQLNVSTA